MTDPLIWPAFLKPSQIHVNAVPFSRSGGTSLGGVRRTTRTDRGWWVFDYKGISLFNIARRRLWNAFRVNLSGESGSFVIPIWSFDTAPWAAGTVNGKTLTTHSDGSPFSDGTLYLQPTIIVTMAFGAVLGDTSVTLRLGAGIDELTGTRFSYQHALYELGIPTAVVGDEWTMPVFPAIRAAIPIDAALEFDLPTCRVRLANDREMDVSLTAGNFDKVDVSFVEDLAFWNDLAAAT